jgi:hypothetical protein
MEAPPGYLADQIRQSIAATLAELGCDSSAGLEEAILIRQGMYCGRRFQCPGGSAIWFAEENQIKFYGAEGRLARVAAGPGTEPDAASTIKMNQSSGAIIPRRRAA